MVELFPSSLLCYTTLEEILSLQDSTHSHSALRQEKTILHLTETNQKMKKEKEE